MQERRFRKCSKKLRKSTKHIFLENGKVYMCLIMVTLVFSPTFAEPVCSKFSFMEQLLEKMVRVEFNVGQMEKEIKHTNSLVLESLQNLKQNWENVAEEFGGLKIEARKVLDDHEERVSKFIEDLKEESKNILEEYDVKMKQLEGAVSVPNIAFNARGPSSFDPQEHAVIVFTKNIVNIGNAYNNVTGIFTAPVDGTYLFTCQLCLHSAKAITFGIFIDDVLYTLGRFYEKDYSICFHVDTTAVMKVEQTASVQSWAVTSGNVLREDGIHYLCMFSGTLIHK